MMGWAIIAAELNLVALAIALYSYIRIGRSWELALAIFYFARTFMLPLFFPVTWAVKIDLIIGVMLALGFVLWYLRVDARWMRILLVALMSVLPAVGMALHCPSIKRVEAALSYTISMIVLGYLWRSCCVGELLVRMTYAYTFLSDVRELVVLCYYDLDIHFPFTFLLDTKMLSWIALAPLLAKLGSIRIDKTFRTLALIFTPIILANLFHVYQLPPYRVLGLNIGIIFVRLLPVISLATMFI